MRFMSVMHKHVPVTMRTHTRRRCTLMRAAAGRDYVQQCAEVCVDAPCKTQVVSTEFRLEMPAPDCLWRHRNESACNVGHVCASPSKQWSEYQGSCAIRKVAFSIFSVEEETHTGGFVVVPHTS